MTGRPPAPAPPGLFSCGTWSRFRDSPGPRGPAPPLPEMVPHTHILCTASCRQGPAHGPHAASRGCAFWKHSSGESKVTMSSVISKRCPPGGSLLRTGLVCTLRGAGLPGGAGGRGRGLHGHRRLTGKTRGPFAHADTPLWTLGQAGALCLPDLGCAAGMKKKSPNRFLLGEGSILTSGKAQCHSALSLHDSLS